MRIPQAIGELYRHAGPFATAYLDTSRDAENADHEIELRWRELAGRLSDAGADRGTLDAMAAVAGAHRERGGRRGQALVGAGGAVLADLSLPRPPRRDLARWSPLPHLMPYFAQLDPAVPYVLVVTDRTGADLYWADSGAAAQHSGADHRGVDAEHGPVHKTSTADWSERHFQQRVDNAWAANARDVADAVAGCVARVDAELVVLAGDVRARALVAESLPAAVAKHVAVEQVEPGARGAGASDDALDDAVRDALHRQEWRRRRLLLEQLREQLARDGVAVQGIEPVVEALQRAQAETVVISDDPTSTAHAWIGPEPLQLATRREELDDAGVDAIGEDRLDAALVRAVAGSGAELVVTPNAHHYLCEGIAALLRYRDAATGEAGERA